MRTTVPYRRWRLAVLALVTVLFAATLILGAVLFGPALGSWLHDLLP